MSVVRLLSVLLALVSATASAQPQRLRVPVGDSVATGPADALVTIVSFQDYQCPFCSRGSDTVDRVVREFPGQIRVVFKHNPLPFHKDAMPAAEAAEAAGAQGKFSEMHSLLFRNQRALKREHLHGYARQLSLDMDRFAADLASGVHRRRIEADQALAAKLGARGTPHFFINGWSLRGAQPIEKFREQIEVALKEAGAAVARGVPAGRVYNEVTKDAPATAPPPKPRPPRPPRRQRDPGATYHVPVGDAQALSGPEDALVTLVAFTDYQCPFCGRAEETRAGLQARYGRDLRIVVKHNPLPFHEQAGPAAEAALAASARGLFPAMHAKLFDNQKQLDGDALARYAVEVGLSATDFQAWMEGSRGAPTIAAHQKQAEPLGAPGTPPVYINGRRLDGALPASAFVALVDAVLAEAGALVAAGTPRAKVYEEVIRDGSKSPVFLPSPPPQEAKEDERKEVLVAPSDPARGPAKARVTLVAFLDFECPFCRRSAPVLDRLARVYANDLRVVVKQHPLAFHKKAMLAAEAALAAHEQGHFWEMYALLFAHAEHLDPPDLEGYARRIGLDVGQFAAALRDHRFRSDVEADIEQAKSLGLRGTPAFFVNGRHVRGAQPYEHFTKLIDEELGR